MNFSETMSCVFNFFFNVIVLFKMTRGFEDFLSSVDFCLLGSELKTISFTGIPHYK